MLRSKNIFGKIAICCINTPLRPWCVRSRCHPHVRSHSQKLESRYNNLEKIAILKVLNESESEFLARYSITKVRLKNIIKWRQSNGHFKSLSDVGVVEGFSERLAEKLFDSVISDSAEKSSAKEPQKTSKVRGQVLSPLLTDAARKSIKRVVAVHVTVNSVTWCSLETDGYRLDGWGFHDIRTPDEKKLQIADILQIAQQAVAALPAGDAYVLEAPPTTLRAAGGDPANPRVMTINLQRAQLVAMLVALIDSRISPLKLDTQENQPSESLEMPTAAKTVYFLRSTLPSRLFRTLVGNERVSAEQTVLTIFSESKGRGVADGPAVLVPSRLQEYFAARRETDKEDLGQCLLLGLTFMEVCYYSNRGSIDKLIKQKGSVNK